VKATRLWLATAVFGLFFGWTVPAQAHHSAVAEYDLYKEVDLTGTLTKIEWINPHGWLYMDVKDPDGKIQHWALETVPPEGWRRAGILSKGVFAIGETYKIQGSPAKAPPRNGVMVARINVVVLPDGRKITLYGGTQQDGSN
jgi:Family of unknown function (DUF6152)